MSPRRDPRDASRPGEPRPGTLSRREFVKLTGFASGGMLVSVWLPGCDRAAVPRATAAEARLAGADAFSPDAMALTPWFRIEPDGRVTVFAQKIEMGQGTMTSLPMILADELDVEWGRVVVAPAPLAERTYGWQGAGGSTSVWQSWTMLRRAGATARHLLREAAANRWNVPASECETGAGRVTHSASGNTAHYGELAADAAALPVPDAPVLKDHSAFHIIGRPTRQVGLEAIVTGRTSFGIDTRADGALRASVERAPVLGARPQRVDDAEARAVRGVRDVILLDKAAHPSILHHGVAVLADATWPATKGRRALRVEWSDSEGRAESSESIAARFRDAIARPGKVLRSAGDADAALRGAATTIEADYEVPFLAHAPMEPGNCFADVRADSVLLRGPLQDPAEAVMFAAEITGIPRERVRIEHARLGGGFGRRLSSDYAAEAAYLSMKAGAPVQVVWTREDDIRFDMYRPAALHRLAAGLDASGRVIAWTHRQVSTSRYGYQAPDRPPESSEVYPDDPPAGMVANYRVEYSPVESLLPRGAWRSVVHSGNAFVTECFTDEVAHAAGIDPVSFRLAMYGEDRELPYRDHGGPVLDVGRLRRVLEVAAEAAGWGGELPGGHAHGVAVRFTFGGYAAQIAEVSVDVDGAVRVHRVTASIDCGTPVNPSGIRAQVVGGIVFGLTAALHGEITVRDGGVVQGNFDDYPLLRIDRMPEIDVHMVPSTRDPGGTGEMSVPPIAPAVANAVFAATGERVRRTPIRPDARRA